ncbi:hypothetical protein [Brevundimonas sp.]|uniref:hypothetical protein n=1 Tax=Brevundimonas sp. TaxID=1871086 RepID=UPI00289DE02C|nr:hypothetical protein [Brevundimonas sp.]
MAGIIRRQPAPWHLWLIGILALLWNGYGAFDFSMTLTRGADYLRDANMSEAMVQYFHALPGWLYAPWGLGVWGGVLGAICLLLRERWAVWAFALSLAGAVGSNIVSTLLYPPPAVAASQGAMAILPYAIIAIAAGLWVYAWRMARKSVLV